MASSVIGALRVNLGLDAAQFYKGVRKTQSTIEQTARKMRNVGAIASAAITAPLVIAGRDMVKLAGQQEQAMKVVEQGVETTGKAAGFAAADLFKMASGLQEVTRFGDEDILENVTGQLLTFTNVAGDEFARAQEAILNISTVMKTDLKSASIQVGKALNDPVAGLSALSRSGIQFTEDQKDMVAALVEVGDVAGAQALILDELEKQFGGQAAAAAETFNGKVDQLSNSWGDLKEEFGAIIIEFLPPLIEGLRDLVDWFQNLDPEVKEMGVKMGLLAAAVGPVATVLGGLVLGVVALGAPVAVVITAIAGLTAGMALFWPEIINAKDAVIEFGRDALDYITALPEKVLAAFAALPDQMMQIGRDILGGLKDGLAGKFAEVKDSITGFAGGIVTSVKDSLGIRSPSRVFREIGVNIMEGLGIGVSDGAAGVMSEVDGFASDLVDAGETVADKFGSSLKSAFLDFASGATTAKDAANRLLDSLADLVLNAAFQSFVAPAIDAGMAAISGTRADGGPVGVGRTYLVGERGPELFTPSGSGTIIPNHKLGGGGTVVNMPITVHNEAGGNVAVDAQQSGDGIRLFIRDQMRGMIGSGEMDQPMSRYGLRPRARGR